MAILKRKSSTGTVTIPAPTGGWNTRDAEAAMKQTDAIRMVNFFPDTTDVRLRKGYIQHVTGIGAAVETLMPYSSGTVRKLFGASGTSIYDVSTAGAVGAAVVTSMGNARWQFVNITNASAVSFLLAVNGADKMRYYDGSNWTADGATYTVTGVDTAACDQINVFKNRVWLVQENSLKVWYLPVSAVAGAATAFDLASVTRKGGYVMAMENWTLDAGTGVDDHAVFITSKGEVVVYKGSDPASATTWSLVGVWEIGEPMGKRCTMKYAGDCLLITSGGLVPLSSALLTTGTDQSIALSDKINPTVVQSAVSHGSDFGWQAIQYPGGGMIIMNVPTAGTQEQYVMNINTKAWCQWTGIPASCWALFNGEIFFGGPTFVGKAWSGDADNAANIEGECKQAFDYFGFPGALKRWTMARPIIKTNGSPTVKLGMNVDFDDTDVTGTVTHVPSSTVSLWGTAIWGVSLWGGGERIVKAWQTIRGNGFAGAIRMKIASKNATVRWSSTTVVFEKGAVV